MKGPNTAMAWAVKAVAESGVDLAGDVMVSLSVGEEFGQGRDIGAAQAVQALQDEGREVDLAVVGEPTNLEIHNKSSFLFDYEIEIEGKSTHASNKGALNYPQRRGIPDGRDVGVDAGKLMTDVLRAFERLEHDWNMTYRDTVWGSGGYPEPTDLAGVGATCLTNCILEAGEYIAGVPGSARIYGNVYGPPSVEPATLWGEMQDAVDALAATDSWLADNPPEMAWKVEFDFPAIQTPIDHPACDVLDDVVSDVRGEQATFSGFKAVNDGSFIYEDCGVDVVTLGPGHISMNAHGPDEYLPLDQFRDAAKIYAKLLLDWCGVAR
jgi:acetylornithine deacetylase